MTFLPSFCTPAEARTLDTLIKSQVLYQLSYKRISHLRVQRYALYFIPPNFFAIFFKKLCKSGGIRAFLHKDMFLFLT